MVSLFFYAVVVVCREDVVAIRNDSYDEGYIVEEKGKRGMALERKILDTT